MILSNLCDDILNYISTLINIKCHVCYKKFDYKNNFYKKQGKFYYCCKECYLFT
jgi:hypothetical protein